MKALLKPYIFICVLTVLVHEISIHTYTHTDDLNSRYETEGKVPLLKQMLEIYKVCTCLCYMYYSVIVDGYISYLPLALSVKEERYRGREEGR